MNSEMELYIQNRATISTLRHNNSVLKWKMCKDFRHQHKSLFMLVDMLWILCIVFNFGALAITNVMVVKNHPSNITFVEANPIMAKRENFVTSTGVQSHFYSFIRQSILWSIILSIYFWMRFNTKSYTDWYIIVFISIFYVVGISTDFLNDYGYWIGIKLFGG